VESESEQAMKYLFATVAVLLGRASWRRDLRRRTL